MCFFVHPSGEERWGPTYQWGKSLLQEMRKWFLYLWSNKNVSCNNARLYFPGKSTFTKLCFLFLTFLLLLDRYLIFWMCFIKADGKVMLKFKCVLSRDSFLNSLFYTWFLHYSAMGNNSMGVHGGGGERRLFLILLSVIFCCCCCSGPHKQATHLCPLEEFTKLLSFAKFT